MDLFKGKREIRIYYKKLEDFPGFNTIDKLKEDINFKTTAIETVRLEMESWMDKEGITIDYIRDELNKISLIRENLKTKQIVELTLLVSELKKEIKSLR